MELGFELVWHPLYFPDLAPLDYHHLFSNEKMTGREDILLKEDVIAEMTVFCRNKPAILFDTNQQTKQRWTKCISLQNDYVDK